MSTNTASVTRRRLVTGALAGVAGWLGASLGRAADVRAATGDPLVLGAHNTAGSQTNLDCSDPGSTGLRILAKSVGSWSEVSGAGDGAVGVIGQASQSTGVTYGVQGVTDSDGGLGVWGDGGIAGVRGTTDVLNGAGVWGSGATYGVRGDGSETGVRGDGSEAGVRGLATSDGLVTAGVLGEASGEDAAGVRGEAKHPAARGVVGRNLDNHSTADAVFGESRGPTSTGVHGLGGAMGLYGETSGVSGIGVKGRGGAVGVLGTTIMAAGVGVRGEGGSAGGSGVEGLTEAPGAAGVFGSNIGGGDGVIGTSDAANAAGVHGSNGAGSGVWGETGAGVGVHGSASSGTAGSFEAPTGRALYANGPVQLDMASGIANVRDGSKFVDVVVGFALGSTAKILATLQSSAGGKTSVCLAEVIGANAFRIQLTEKATADCRVGWLVLL